MEKGKLWLFIIIGLVAFGFAWYLISPLFIDKVFNEDLPAASITEENGSSNVIYNGSFIDADSFHKTSGTATIFESEGKKYVRFDNFQTTNGPDLKVYLSNDLRAKDYISLGDLKGNIGNQNYEIPESVDFDRYDKVLIWCEPFSVLFGSADLG